MRILNFGSALALLISIASMNIYAQDDYSYYLNNARKALSSGNIELAQKHYSLYKKISGRTDKSLEREIAEMQAPDNEWTVNGVSFKMINVAGGTFLMGATEEQGYYEVEDNPSHQVTLGNYCIGETEVTQALWKAVMGTNPSVCVGDALPVDNVSWFDCQEFIRKLNQLTAMSFRLPTEAEWEFAARGGRSSRSYRYSGSNTISDVAWYYNNNISKSKPSSRPVATKESNELGIYDMSGNVWEWCQDWYKPYARQAQTDPKGPDYGTYRVFRGGSHDSMAEDCRIALRYNNAPNNHYYNVGFRLALSRNTFADASAINDSKKNSYVEEEAIPFTLVEEKPSFQGGDANQFSKWVNSQLVYPEAAKNGGIQGRVTVQFTVNTDGSVCDISVLRGADPSLDREAVRVVSNSPKWKPGRQKGKAVRVTYTFPVIFQLK